MEHPNWYEEHTGALTPHFVGRESLLEQMRKILQNPSKKNQVVFLTGRGGNGKTRLVNETINIARQLTDNNSGLRLFIPSTSVDMYHVVNHTPNGLAYSLFQVFTPPTDPFENYENDHNTLDRLWLASDTGGVAIQLKRELETFTGEMANICAQNRVVIVLDTIEKLLYGEAQSELGSAYIAESWKWLISALPKWENVVLILAGRPESLPLIQELSFSQNIEISTIEIGPFDLNESLAYFDAVERAAVDRNRLQIAERIHTLTQETRSLAHNRSGGRPIMLALLVDFLATPQGQSDAAFTSFLVDSHILEKEIIARLCETTRIGATIVALGRLPKGADEKLLSKVLDVPIDDGERRLAEVKDLSFVKIRTSDKRIFLHDEMYSILHRQVYDFPNDAPAAKRVGDAILKYYETVNSAIRSELDSLYEPVEKHHRNRLNLTQLAEAHGRRQVLLNEVLYYRLRQNPVLGFKRGYRYMREAVLSDDLPQYIHYQVELKSFLLEMEPLLQNKNDIDGLSYDLLTWELSLFGIIQAWISRKYDEMLEEIKKIRSRIADTDAENLNTKTAILNAWEGSALYFLGGDENLQTAMSLYNHAINNLENSMKINKLPDDLSWYTRAVLASTYRMRAYLQRVRGAINQALQDYKSAATLLREIDLRIELSTTLNDMGFAYAELDKWAEARALVSDAMNLRRYLGPRTPVALSFNTLATIDIREGDYKEAIDNAESALGLARALEHKRSTGLALNALAEAQRRYSNSDRVTDIQEKVNLLRAARDHAQEAKKIFKETGEKIRLTEALIEIGCACRDWVLLLNKYPNPRDDSVRLLDEAVRSLREAVKVAGNSILYKKLDALVNLAWVGYISDNPALIDEATNLVRSATKDYWSENSRYIPQKSVVEAQPLVWPQIGKLEVLLGHLEYNKYVNPLLNQENKDLALARATRHYFWSLEYNSLHSSDYQGMRKAKNEIYVLLNKLPSRELKKISRTIKDLELDTGKNSSMRAFMQDRALWYED